MQPSDNPISTEGAKSSNLVAAMNFSDVVRTLWAHRKSGVVIFIVCMVLSTTYLNLTTHKYTATLVVTPADQSGSDAAGLSGLGSLVGVNLSGKQGSSFEYYDDAIKSDVVAQILSRDINIMKVIYSDQWDKNSSSWKEKTSKINKIATAVKRIMGQPARNWQPPSGKDLREYVISNVSITQETLTQKYTIVYRHKSPIFAKYFLDRLNYSADEFLRSSSIKRAEIYSNYIENKLRNVSISEYRESLVKSLSTYEKTKMMAGSDASFAVEKFGNTVVSKYPTDPDVIMTTFLNVFLGFVIWIFYIFGIKRFFRYNNAS